MAPRVHHSTATLDVVGLKFRWKEDVRRSLADICEKGAITGIRIEREPDNRFDPNALTVSLPERLMGGKQLGYIRKETAELLASRIDAGTLTIVRAKLLSLDAEDRWQTGELQVTFNDKGKKSPAKS